VFRADSQKIQNGTRTGDILNDVLSGKDGFKGRRHELVIARLANIQTLANYTNKSPKQNELAGQVCLKCRKSSLEAEFQNNLLVCGRCKQAYYCSKSTSKPSPKLAPLASICRAGGRGY
jgi:ribosomal protein S27AE